MMKKQKNRALFFVLISALLGFAHPSFADITLLEPTAAVEYPEGDDFAQTVLQNSWDFNERRDLGWEEGFDGRSISTQSGIWHGTLSAPGGYVFPLFAGFQGSLLAEGVSGDRSLPRFGTNHPIDASRYTYLSIGMRHSSASSIAIYWNPANGTTWPDGTNFGARLDGYYSAVRQYRNVGRQVELFDLTSPASFEVKAGSWSGLISSLRIDPSLSAPPGSAVDLDFIRLVDPRTSPTVRMSWRHNSTPPSDSTVSLMVDTDAAGFDGWGLKHFSSIGAPTTFSFPSAALPPGEYYFYVEVHQPGNPALVYSRSGYSPRIRISAAPTVAFNSPTTLTGEEYSSRFGNAWDFSDSTDVANLGASWPDLWRQFTGGSFTNGTFQALTTPPLPGATETDAQIHLNFPGGVGIDPRRYRYLTYRVGADESAHPSISEKVRDGFVTRPIFWGNDLFVDGGAAKAHILYEGMHTYTVDLWDANTIESGVPFSALPNVFHLRVDPLETSIPTWFYFDSAALTAEPRPDGAGNLAITWSVSDQDSGSIRTRIYRDINSSGFDGVFIGEVSSAPSSIASLQWNTNGLPAGRYFLYAESFDGTNTRRIYNPTPVVVGNSLATFPPAPPVPSTPGVVTPPAPPPAQIALSALAIKSVRVRGGRKGYRIDATVQSSSPVRSAVATARNSRGRLRGKVTLKPQSSGVYSGVWTPNLKATERITVTVSLQNRLGGRVTRTAGTIKVSR